MKKKPLDVGQKQKLLVMLAEARARGLPVPNLEQKINAINKSKSAWPVDENGYFIANDGKRYAPNEQQAGFIADDSRFVSYIGGRGSGKSAAGAQKTAHHIKAGRSGAVFNPDFENFRTSTWPELRYWLPWSMVVPSQRHRSNPEWEAHKPFVMVFVNGARLYCKGLKNKDAARGPNLSFLWYDEGGRDPSGESWKIANAAVRIGDMPQAYVTATPKGKNHWLYKLFVQKEISKDALDAYGALEIKRNLIAYYHGSIEDNRNNLSPDFFAMMLANYPSGYLREQELRGNFADEGGKVGFSEWFTGKVVDKMPDDFHAHKQVRYWDMAATEKKLKNDPDEAVGTLVTKYKGKDDWSIDDQVGVFFAWDKLKLLIADVARRDGPYVTVVIEEEPGSGGKNQVAELRSYFKQFPELANHKVIGQRPTDRALEANFWFGLASAGKVYLIRGPWIQKFLEQVDGFLQMSHDDRITSTSGAFRSLSPFKSWKKQEFFVITG